MLFEGFSEEQILNLPKEAIEILVLAGEPLVFRPGSAAVLGSFKVTSIRLTIERHRSEAAGRVCWSPWFGSQRDTQPHLDWLMSTGSCTLFRAQDRIPSFGEYLSDRVSSSDRSAGSTKPTPSSTP